MTTVSDIFVAAETAAEPDGGTAETPVEAAYAQARARAGARARLAVTQRAGKGFVGSVFRDVAGAWVWRDAPPPLRQVVAVRTPSLDAVPDGSPPLRWVWLIWNHAVAVPASAVLYAAAWLLQHPARAAVAATVAVPLILMWII